jgi:hypothetical protein
VLFCRNATESGVVDLSRILVRLHQVGQVQIEKLSLDFILILFDVLFKLSDASLVTLDFPQLPHELFVQDGVLDPWALRL